MHNDVSALAARSILKRVNLSLEENIICNIYCLKKNMTYKTRYLGSKATLEKDYLGMVVLCVKQEPEGWKTG